MVYDGDPEPQRLADAARGELNAVLHADLARCRREPDASITSQVSNDPDPGVDDDEAVAQLRVIMFGGIETIQAAIMNTLLLLLRDPAQLEAVRADASAARERGRGVAAPDPAGRLHRALDGGAHHDRRRSSSGPASSSEARCSPPTATRATFADPLRYDVHRENARRHLAFSFGEHFCLGAHLARLEITEALGHLLDRLPGLRLVACEEPAGFAFRRPARLALAWEDG